MTKFKTLRGLAGYLVRQEGKMAAKKSRAKIGDTMQILNALCDLIYLQENPYAKAGNSSEIDVTDILYHVAFERGERAQKGKKK